MQKKIFSLAVSLAIVAAWLASCRPAPPAAPTPKSGPAKAADLHLEYVPIPIGAPVSEFGRPIVTNLGIFDLDGDGLLDVLYCDAQKNTVRWIRQAPRGVFTEQIIGEDIPAPAHVWTADVNGSGRQDVLVASMGQLTPNNDRIGAVIVLENLDNQHFRKRVLIDHVARVTDVRAANLTSHKDKLLDLVVGQFGYSQGETRWMENKGNWQFESHIVNTQSGCIHTPVADFDGDGQPDFAALISQEWEEVHWFHNTGGQFQDSVIWGSTNEDYGSSGLAVADVNRDGKPDLIYTNGDGFDYALKASRPWHGIQWIENKGFGYFQFHRVGDMPGAYSPCAVDLNGDGYIDLLAVSCFADWSDPNAVSMMAWINDGHENFTPVVLAHNPIQLVTAAVGDLDGNGVPVIVTGGLHALPPFDRMSNITLWRKK
ncbi:MAG TPA: VCBS repeat-containing protein [Candidatus Didemnitutus sp.]|nr:VCBS repeat-containing protein [Candidatus Didemnitutus sp.]